MALKRIVREEDRKVEKYSTGDTFGRKFKGVASGSSDVVGAVGKLLGDYCEFRCPSSNRGGRMGGPVPDEYWHGEIKNAEGNGISVVISQSYGQPGRFLIGAKAEMKYDVDVSDEDLGIVRKALIDSGLKSFDA